MILYLFRIPRLHRLSTDRGGKDIRGDQRESSASNLFSACHEYEWIVAAARSSARRDTLNATLCVRARARTIVPPELRNFFSRDARAVVYTVDDSNPRVAKMFSSVQDKFPSLSFQRE